MDTKTCKKCGVEKPKTSEFFQPCARHRDGFEGRCRCCKRAVARETAARRSPERAAEVRENIRRWQEQNRGRVRALSAQYHKENASELRAKKAHRYVENREIVLQKRKEYHAKTRDERNEAARKYRRENAERVRSRSAERYRRRYGIDPHFTLGLRVRNLVRDSLNGRRKSGRTFDILGYTAEDLKFHIESKFKDGMTMGALLRGEIHIDHIRPVASFDITSEYCEDFKKCWALDNLQPLWAFDNLSKGAKYDPNPPAKPTAC